MQPPHPGATPNYAHTGYGELETTPLGWSNGTKSPYEGDRFKPKKKINDPIFLTLFVAQFLAFAALSGVAFQQWVSMGSPGGGLGKDGAKTGTSITLNRSTVYLLLFVAATAMVLSIIYLIITRHFTKIIVHATLTLSVCLNIALCVYYWIVKYYSGAIVFTIIALISAAAYWVIKDHIAFSSLLLQVVIDVSKHHKSVFVVAFVALLAQVGLAAWFVFTVIATYVKWTPGGESCATASCSAGTVAGLIFFELFSFLWTSQVIGNVALSTVVGGPYGTWYYFGPKDQGQMPPHPTLSAFVRASTTSLGSIAFGSLVVTILEVIKIILRSLQRSAGEAENPIFSVLACCAACLIGCIENFVEYFNRYAYIEIALYGKSYIPAAKDTWRLFKDRGIKALVNDSLVGITMTWGAYITGCVCSLFAFLYLRYTAPSYNAEGQYTAPVVLFSFLIAIMCCATVTAPIEAGVSTIFVGLAEDPQVLQVRAPELFAMIAQHYPEVLNPAPVSV